MIGFLIIFGLVGGLALLKIIIDIVVIKNTVGDFYNHHNIVIYFVYVTIQGFNVAVVVPLVLCQAGVMIKYEYIIKEDLDEI